MKFGKVFAIKTKPCKTLLECLNSYSKVQLEILTDRMNLDRQIKKSATKAERVLILKEKILERLDYLFDYLDSYDFVITAVFAKEDDNEKLRVLMNFMKDFGEGAEDRIMHSNMTAIENGLMFLFVEDEDNPMLILPDEVREKISELVPLAKAEKYRPGNLNSFMYYGEVLSDLYGLCPTEVFLEIYERDFPSNKISKQDLNLFLERAALISGNYCVEDNLIKSNAVYKQIEKYILEDRKKFKPYIPSKNEIFEHMGLLDYDADNDAYKKMVKFFEKEIGDEGYGEDIALDIVPMIKVCYSLQEIVDYIQNEYGIISNINSMEKFLPLYQNLVNTSHLWSNWGHTPDSLVVLNGKDKKAAYNDGFLEELKNQKENRPHIALPENCVVPSDNEIKKVRDKFDEYWGKNAYEPAWHENGDRILSRVMKEVKSNINTLSQFPESAMNQLFDQWLASLYHANANRSGDFGNQKWNYYAFEIAEKIRDGLYTCLLADGTPILIASPGFNRHFEEDYFCCLTVLVDMGGWYLTYGPQLVWKGIEPRDIEVLAKSVAAQTYELKGLSGVIHFNPVPFWCAQQISNIPPMAHKGNRVVQCYAETRFLNGEVPEFPAKWEHEVSEKKSGKIERWICNKDDYLGNCAVYLDKKTGAVLMYSCNEALFDKSLEKLNQFFDLKHCETTKNSMIFATVIRNNKREKLLNKFEAAF